MKIITLVLLTALSVACGTPDPRQQSGGVITTYIVENGDTCYRAISGYGVALSCVRD